MLYLDYSRKDGEWIPNVHGGREHLEAIGLLQEANATAYKRVPGIVTIAEESTSWPGVTKATSGGGLGFGLKWNMGWMNDTLRYLKEEPIHRQYHHNLLTFSLMYAFSENYLLPISHDEVVHGKGSLLTKIPGDARATSSRRCGPSSPTCGATPASSCSSWAASSPSPSEWADGRSLDWWLLDHAAHYRVHALVKELNRVYREHPAMWALDAAAGRLPLARRRRQHRQRAVLPALRAAPTSRATSSPPSSTTAATTRRGCGSACPARAAGRSCSTPAASTRRARPSQAGAVLEAEASPWHDQPYSVTVRVAARSSHPLPAPRPQAS